jgi:ribosomal-protein-serine acetyltransferase
MEHPHRIEDTGKVKAVRIQFSSLRVDEEIELRLLDESHAEPLFTLVDQHREYLRTWLPWLDSNLRVEDTMQFILNDRANYESGRCFNTGIWYRGLLVGVIGFHPIDWPNRSAMIGYWVARDQQGKGIMTRACAALTTFAFDELKLHRVDIRCATSNTKSCAIPLRLGFTHEGILREAEWLYDHFVDLNVYSMLEREWKNQQRSSLTPQR